MELTFSQWVLLKKIFVFLQLVELTACVRPEIYTAGERTANLNENVYIYSGAKKAVNDTIYLVIASKMVRPGQVYRLTVSLPSTEQSLVVRAFLQRNGEQISSATEIVSETTVTLLMQVPFNAIAGTYHLRIEGNTNGHQGGRVFLEQTDLTFSERFLTIAIETNQLVYNLEQTMHIRVILLTTELKPFVDPIDAYLVDSRGFVMKRWVSVYPYLGFVNLKFDLPYDYSTGWWTIRVNALGQTEETKVLLERWFGHRFDVNVATPTFILNTEDTLTGSILANYTNVATVTGNLTLKALLRPLDKLKYAAIDWSYRYLEEYVPLFQGTYDFSFNMEELRRLATPVPLENCEIEVQAVVGERFQDFVVHAYGRTRVIASKVYIRFLGATPQIFKPGMPFRTHLITMYDDLVPLEDTKLETSSVFIDPVAIIGGRRQQLPPQRLTVDQGGISVLELEPPANAERLYIRATYEDEADRDSIAHAELNVLAFYSQSNRWLQISTSTKTAQAGEYAVFHVWSNFYLKSFSYVVVSKGIILMSSSQEVYGMIRSITTFSVPVSTEMAPVFHVIVYHITPDAEVIADSITVPVHAINKRRFVLDINMNQERSGNYIELVPRLTSETIVGVSGFDTDHISTHGRRQLTPTSIQEAMYGFEDRRLKYQRAIWRDREGGPEKIAYFTTHNIGRDSHQTFEVSDLVVFTNLRISAVQSFCNSSLGLRQCASGQCYLEEQECDGKKDCDDGSDEGNCFQRLLEEEEDLFNFFLYRRNRQGAFYDATADNFAWKNKIIGSRRIHWDQST